MSSIARPSTTERPTRQASSDPTQGRLPIIPHLRYITAVDIEKSTSRTNMARATLRSIMYQMLELAMLGVGIGNHGRDELVDRGDGILAFIHPVDQIPKTRLLAELMPKLSVLLADHNDREPVHALRMRAVVHAGDVLHDGRGYFGEAVDLACRLLDAPEVKEALADTEAPLVLVVSDDIYDTVVRHGYDGIDQGAFTQLVHVRLGERRYDGWVTVPCAAVPCQRTER